MHRTSSLFLFLSLSFLLLASAVSLSINAEKTQENQQANSLSAADVPILASPLVRSAYVPVRTSNPVPAANEFGQKETSLWGLPHPSIFIPAETETTTTTTSTILTKQQEPISQPNDDAGVEKKFIPTPADVSENNHWGDSSWVYPHATSGGEDDSNVESTNSPSIPSTPADHPLSRHHESVEFDGMRDQMLTSKWLSNTAQSSSNSMSFLRNFPRKKADGSAGKNQLQRLGGPFNRTAMNSAESDPIGDYVAGLFFMYGVPLFFAMLCIVCWAGFCIGRCACNLCGRHATVLYTDKQVRINYALSVALVVIMFVCAAFGWTGNVEVSQGVDSGFNAADALANFGYEFMGVASTAYAIGFNALLIAVSLNSTMEAAPTPAAVFLHQTCLNGSDAALTQQTDFVVQLHSLNQYFKDDPTNTDALVTGALGVGTVQKAINDFSDPQDPIPAGATPGQSQLMNLEDQLISIENAFATVPSAATITNLIDALTNGVDTQQTSAGSLAALQALNANFVPFLVAAKQIAPVLDSALEDQYRRLEEGINTVFAGGVNGELYTAIKLGESQSPNFVIPLNNSLLAVRNAISKGGPTGDFPLPNEITSMRMNVATLQTNLAAINVTLSAFDVLCNAYTATLSSWPSTGTLYSDLSTYGTDIANFQIDIGLKLQLVVGVELPNLIKMIKNLQATITPAINSFAHTQNQISTVTTSAPLDPTETSINSYDNSYSADNGQGVLCLLDVMNMLAAVNESLVIMPWDVTEAIFRLTPPLQAQKISSPNIPNNIIQALEDIQIVRDIIAPGGAPDYSGLTTALVQLNTSISNLPNFPLLWEELLVLSNSLSSVAGINGVNVVRVGASVTTDGWSSATPAAIWSNVASVTPSVADPSRGEFSALDPVLNFDTRLQMATAIPNMKSLAIQLKLQLGYGNGLDYSTLQSHVDSLTRFELALTGLTAKINTVYPVTLQNFPFQYSLFLPLNNSLGALYTAIIKRPDTSSFQSVLNNGGLNSTLGSDSARANIADIEMNFLGMQAIFTSISSLTTNLPTLQSTAQLSNFPRLQSILTGAPGSSIFDDLQTYLTDPTLTAVFPSQNSLVQSMTNAFQLPGANNLIDILDHGPALSLSTSATDSLKDTMGKLTNVRDSFPDMNERYAQGQAGLEAISGALAWMQMKKEDYQKAKTDFQFTVNNYDGVRLLVFNLGVLLPFVLSFFLLLAAVQHYGCPAMIAGLTFFPLFVLFMAMAAVQMPVSVALSDHCYNTTGEIKIQTEGRVYEKDRLLFLGLTKDIDIPSVVDYFTECQGNAPEILERFRNPLQVLIDQGIEINQIEAQAHASIGLDFAEPLQTDLDNYARLQNVDLLNMFDAAVSKMNCSRTSGLYHQTMSALCSDFAPAFALTTCVFLMTAFCMLPGICLGITSYKRFDPMNRDTAYARAPAAAADDVHVMPDQSAPEGWN
jgi:hypothetical protein